MKHPILTLTLIALLCSTLTACDIVAPNLDDTQDTNNQTDTTPQDTNTQDTDADTKDTAPNPEECRKCNPNTEFCTEIAGVSSCTNYPQIAVGFQHTCAILSNGQIQCWGNNGNGQLGFDNALGNSISPQPKHIPLQSNEAAKFIAAGKNNTCAVSKSNKIFCWGTLSVSESDNSTDWESKTPKQIEHPYANGAPHDPIVQLVTGYGHSCVRHELGKVFCWGTNQFGQLGIGQVPTPAVTDTFHMSSLLGDATYIAASFFQTCAAVAPTNTLYCWGYNHDNFLGLTHEIESSGQEVTTLTSPIAIEGIKDVQEIALGRTHICTISSSEDLHCWGINDRGQLGTKPPHRIAPTPRSAERNPQQPIKHVAAGDLQTFALPPKGPVLVTGFNKEGQLAMEKEGIPNQVQYEEFTPNDMLNDVHRIEANSMNGCAIHTDGAISCWGANKFGNVGTGEQIPVIIQTPTKIYLSVQ